MKKVLLLAVAGLFLVACGNCGSKKADKAAEDTTVVEEGTKAECGSECSECEGCDKEQTCDSTVTE